MGRIDDIFVQARSQGRKLLIPFVVGGFPAPGATGAVVRALEEAGAAIIEIGIPFSDPIADGPVIAQAMHQALERGTTPASVFDEVASVRAGVSAGLVAMVSASIVTRMGGPEEFTKRAASAGFDGLIVPDAPLEESEGLRSASASAGLSLSLLVAPTTPPHRAERIAAASSGFVYLLARTGITGEGVLPPEIGPRVARLRESTQIPIACGFGISTPEHVRAVVREGGADAAIVGSAVVRRMARAAEEGEEAAGAAADLVRELSAGLS
jgi:tryptophan synthase alpha chain